MNLPSLSSRTSHAGLPLHAAAARRLPDHDGLSSCLTTSYASIIAFMAVAAEGNFARAAERLGIGRSAVSRSVQRLEEQLRTRLFLRTTRSTSLTREGERFFRHCNEGVTQIVGAVNDMLDLRHGPPRGLLRVSSGVRFGREVVTPLLLKFFDLYPDVAVDLQLDDEPVDLSAGRIDIAFRDGCLEDSSIIARRLAPMDMMVCAAPSYAQSRGLPETPEELARHDCINLRLSSGRMLPWHFDAEGRNARHSPAGRLTFNDAAVVLRAVLDGRGLAQLPAHQVREHIARGELVTTLAAHAPRDRWHYICYPCREHLPMRVRVFVDFMTEQLRVDGP